MKHEIKIPSLGESISEVTIGQVIAPTGAVIKSDSEILELETDKVNQVLYAPVGGEITLSVKTGEGAKVGQVIGFIETDGKEKKESGGAPAVEGGEVVSQPPTPLSSTLETKASGQRGVRETKDRFLEGLQGAVEGGGEKSPPREKEKITHKKEGGARETRRPLSKIRRVIAQRLVEAQQGMAMLTTFNEVDLTRVIELREKYKDPFIKKYGVKLGFMSFFVRAVVSALEAFPDLNSFIDGDEIVHREYYDIGVAVGTEKGVIVPVIRGCDRRTFAEVEQEIDSYAKKARSGTLLASDLQGGGFTITNGGTYGSLLSTPIVLPPQCGILGMHKIEKRAVVIDDQIVIRSMMYLALSYDHRLIDGKEAVSFLVHIKNALEEPSRLLLEI